MAPPRRKHLQDEPPEIAPSLSTCVYFLYSAGHIKIGKSIYGGFARCAELASLTPVPVSILFTIPGDFKTERQLHNQFAELRTKGEWFVLRPMLRQYIKTHLAQKVGGLTRLQVAEDRFSAWLSEQVAIWTADNAAAASGP